MRSTWWLLLCHYYQTLFNNLQATTAHWVRPVSRLFQASPPRWFFVYTNNWVRSWAAPVFAASRAALDSWTVLFHILSQEGERTDLLPGLLFMLNEFPFFSVEVCSELAGRRQFMDPGRLAAPLVFKTCIDSMKNPSSCDDQSFRAMVLLFFMRVKVVYFVIHKVD